jgi:hypothetical protein
MWDLRFPQQWRLKLWFSGLWCWMVMW